MLGDRMMMLGDRMMLGDWWRRAEAGDVTRSLALLRQAIPVYIEAEL
jgi:hypothetical protein